MCFANTYLYIWAWTCGSAAFSSSQPVFSWSVLYLYLSPVFPLCPGERADPHTLTLLSCFHDSAWVFTIHRFHLSNPASCSTFWIRVAKLMESIPRLASPLLGAHTFTHTKAQFRVSNQVNMTIFWTLYTRASDAEEGIKGKIRINNVRCLGDCSRSFCWEDDQLAASAGWEYPAM